MPFTNAAMVDAANALIAVAKYAQLHSAAAGTSGTSNVTTAARLPITWGTPTGSGSFDIASPLAFTGGAANGPVYSVTLWTASTGGTFLGEFVLSGDTAFNASGDYTVTSIAQSGSSS